MEAFAQKLKPSVALKHLWWVWVLSVATKFRTDTEKKKILFQNFLLAKYPLVQTKDLKIITNYHSASLFLEQHTSTIVFLEQDTSTNLEHLQQKYYFRTIPAQTCRENLMPKHFTPEPT